MALPVLFLAACGGGGGGGGSSPGAGATNRPATQFTVGGSVSGLAGSGLTLANTGSASLAVAANGTFTFPGTLANSATYLVTVATQPTSPWQTCAVTNNAGVVGTANVTNIAVTCVTDTYRVGGVTNGLVGSGLVLRINGAGDLTPAPGATIFPTPLASGSTYDITIAAQPTNPRQTCVVVNGSGTVTGGNISNVNVNCTTLRHPVRGTVSGLVGTGLALRVNGGSDLPVIQNGAFENPGSAVEGQTFNVTVQTQPSSPAQTCVVANGYGAVGQGPVDGVKITCTRSPGRFAYVAADGGLFCHAIDAISHALVPMRDPACGTGFFAATAVDPTGKFGYLIHSSTDEIEAYGIDQHDGYPDSTEPSVATGDKPVAIAIHPTGRFAYVINETSGSISAYTLDDAGRPTAMTGSPFAAGTGPGRLAIDGSGAFLYVTHRGSDSISAFRIDSATGALSTVAGSPYPVGDGPTDLALDPRSRFVYVTADDNRVHAFTIHATTGALTPAGTPAVAALGKSVVVDPSGSFAYVANMTSANIRGFAIDQTTGALTPLPGSPFASLDRPSRLTVHPGGDVLYAVSYLNGSVSTFAIDAATGALTESAPPLDVGDGLSGPNMIAIVP